MDFHELLPDAENSVLRARITMMREDAQNNWLRSLGKNDFIHSKNVEEYLNRLVPDNIKETFDPAEVFVLLYAVYLHDLGYLMDGKSHPKNSYDEIMCNFQKYGLRNRREARAVALVCRGHALEEEFPLRDIPNRFGVLSLSRKPLDLQFLAALFRLADEIDNAYTRVIGYPDQKESMRHRVEFVDIDLDRWSICFEIEPKNRDEWNKLDGMRKYTQERLNELMWVIEPKRLLYNRIELKPDHPPPNPDVIIYSDIALPRVWIDKNDDTNKLESYLTEISDIIHF